MATLVVLYLSFASQRASVCFYPIPAAECRPTMYEIRKNVRAGRLWGVCVMAESYDHPAKSYCR